MRTKRIFPFVFVTSLLLSSGELIAQNDCATCDITTEKMGGTHVDQTVCAGPNAIVCDYRYDKDTDSKCTAGTPDLRACKRAVKTKTYTATNYVAGTCGTRIGRVVTGCGDPTGGPRNLKRDSYWCDGSSWSSAIALPLTQAFSLDVRTPDGPTELVGNRVTALGQTVVAIPASLLQEAIDNLELRNDEILLDLLIEVEAPSRFFLPDQEFAPQFLGDGIRLTGSQVSDGQVLLSLAVARVNLGAFREYAINLAGLNVEAGSLPEIREMPMSETGSALEGNEEKLNLLAEVTSVGTLLASGAGRAGQFIAPSQEPSGVIPWMIIVLASLLVLSWLVFLFGKARPERGSRASGR